MMIPAILVVAVFAVVQSLFGVGLLLFGTPSLLLLGYSFTDTLGVLLPASITVSLLQVWKSGLPDLAFARTFVGWCLVPLILALAAVLRFDLEISLNLFVMALLAVFVVLRVSPRVGARTRTWMQRYDRLWLIVMGVTHGLSNLGGALLLIFAASRRQRKEDIRALVAACYVYFATAQLAVLGLVSPGVYSWSQLGYAILAATVFLVAGQRTFRWVGAPAFDGLLTLVAVAYASLLGLRSAGVL
jgi:uncharacterized membrane protein YfcA